MLPLLPLAGLAARFAAARAGLGRFVNWNVVIAAGIALAVLALAVLHVWAVHDAASKATAARDAWWRGEIARSNGRVREALAAAETEARMTDAQILSKLGETDDALTDAERKLATLAPVPETATPASAAPIAADDGGCRPVPRRCLGLR